MFGHEFGGEHASAGDGNSSKADTQRERQGLIATRIGSAK
jgi:hypothetical protein